MYLADIDRKDLLKFSAFLRDVKQQSPRSVYNKFENIMTFLKAQGVRGLVGKNDWPRFVEEEPEVYEREELEKLFAVCDEEERLWYEFFLMTGMREQEVMHCSWADVNLTRSTVTVRYKPEYGFSPKNYREREIPIPAKLVTSLKAWKAKAEKFCGLVFPTAGCSPKLNFLDDLKVVVERANLDKENFWLHKFRATFATWHLWNSVDLRTVQMSGIVTLPQPLCTCTCRLPGPTIPIVGNTLQIDRLGNVKGQSVLCLKGPLTIENVSLFQSAIRREESFSTVILDLSDVPYIDSTALGALVSAYVSRQKVGRRVVLSGTSERVSKMLKITSVESLFLTFPTLEDAIGDLTRAGTA